MGLGVIHTAGGVAALGGGMGKRSSGSNYYWDDTAYRQQAMERTATYVEKSVEMAAEKAKDGMQELGGAHANPREYPAIQSGNLQDAISSKLTYVGPNLIVGIFGVYGSRGKVSQASYNSSYDDDTPVWKYAYALETGVGHEGKQWPWVNLTLEQMAKLGWVIV